MTRARSPRGRRRGHGFRESGPGETRTLWAQSRFADRPDVPSVHVAQEAWRREGSQIPVGVEDARFVLRQRAPLTVAQPALGEPGGEMLPLILGVVMPDQQMELRQPLPQAGDSAYRLDLSVAHRLAETDRLDLTGREMPQRVEAVAGDQELIAVHLHHRAHVARRMPGGRQQPDRSVAEHILAPLERVKRARIEAHALPMLHEVKGWRVKHRQETEQLHASRVPLGPRDDDLRPRKLAKPAHVVLVEMRQDDGPDVFRAKAETLQLR